MWGWKKAKNGITITSETGISLMEAEEAKKALAIIDYLTDGIIVLDSFRRISFINNKAEEMLGVSENQVLSQHILRLAKFPWAGALISFLDSQKEDVLKKEMALKEDFILEVSMVSMGEEIKTNDALPKKPDTLVVLHDVTKEKMIYRMKNDFITVAAHQLRTPSSAVKWAIGMLLEGDSGPLSAEQQDAMKKAYDANEKMVKLINELLDVSRIEEGGFLSHPVLVDIGELIDDITSLRASIAKKKSINIRIEKQPGLPKVMLDLEKIKMALSILIDNALIYTFPRGTITIGAEVKDEELEIWVADTGIGIPESQIKNVFTKFFRGSNAMKVHTDGSGLGLFIAKSIVEVQGGRIWFNTEEGKGTTFRFTVPVKQKFKEFLDKSFY